MSLALIKDLRAQTGLGIGVCKDALEKNNGDVEAAKKWLRANTKVKLVDVQECTEGRIGSYVHHSGQVGAMVYLTAQTDFNAKSDEFGQLANDIAMHIVAAKPRYIDQEAVPEVDKLEEEALHQEAARKSGKPEHIIPRIVEGKMKSFFKEYCLLEQTFVRTIARHPKITVGDLLKEFSTRTGETVLVREFARFEVGMQ